MPDPLAAGPTTVAHLAVDERRARALLDIFVETLDPDMAVAAAFEEPDGHWEFAAHFRDPPNETAIRGLVAIATDAETANRIAFDTVAAIDWVQASLEGLKPVSAGRFVVYGAHDRARIANNRIGIEIEAALAFGTGHHGTTRGCLIALDALIKKRRPRRILDIGTGTGVLAIAAAKSLRTPVLASDIDRRAVIVARDNARLNGTPSLLRIIHAAGVSARSFRARAPFDLIFANILLGPLQRLARPVADLVAPQGRVILSGLLPAHANAATAAYRATGLTLERRMLVDGWITLVFVRRFHRR